MIARFYAWLLPIGPIAPLTTMYSVEVLQFLAGLGRTARLLNAVLPSMRDWRP